MEELLIESLYNLILEKDITDDERLILIRFKNLIKDDTNQGRIIIDLSENIRLLSVENISKGKTLSPKIAEFYKKISKYSEQKKNIARGIVSLGVIR
ncbi:bacteriocin immunity protein [Streptococcus ovuberis]|uniref:Bacteriocin immunity protein n=1 Tax=Streptococcus ovuberis TaxID=1936207 RepID=A0A7X6MXE0_9STRE|nr:bacteriocin immunity protein [Streptococcus ovuberis]NKZ20142.1 bacteriocin immunity protein [Streptococcus ovuberis]